MAATVNVENLTTVLHTIADAVSNSFRTEGKVQELHKLIDDVAVVADDVENVFDGAPTSAEVPA